MMLLRCAISFIFSFLVSNVIALDLKPITNLDDLTHPHTPKRETSFTGELDLQDLESFYWGAPAGDKLIYANLTVYFPEQYEYVIAMERFSGKLKSVNCGEDMMLEFIDDTAFEYAKRTWNWVNQDVNNSFIMVTNYAGCADEDERLPYVISNIRYDEEQNKAHLTADLREWEEVAHSYTLHVGSIPLTPVHRMLMERGIMPRAADWTLSLGSSYDQNLFSTTVGGWTTSVDATIRTTGSLNVDFDVDVGFLKLKSAAMTINPQDVAASIQLALTEKGTLANAYTWQKTVLSIPIQGITIAKVVKLGAFLDVDVGFTMEEWTGEAHASLGARMELSNSAVVTVDLVNSENNKFSGWTPSFTPIPLTLSAKVEGSAKVYAEPNVKLEASALGKGWNVGLNMKMPYISANFAAMLDSTGVCDTKKTLGVDVDAKIGVELTVQAATKGNEGNPFWEHELYSKEWDLFSKCLPFGPDNAGKGEVVEPNPASKSKKSSSSRAPKTSDTPEPTSSKPKSTPASSTSSKKSSKSTPASSTSSKKSSKSETDEPTKLSSKSASKTKTAEPTESSTSKTGKPSSSDKASTTDVSSDKDTPSSSKTSSSKKPSGTDESSTSKTTSTASDSTLSAKPTTSDETGSTKSSTSDSASKATSDSIISTTPTTSDETGSTKSSTSDSTSKTTSDVSKSSTTHSPSTFSTVSWRNTTRGYPTGGPEPTHEGSTSESWSSTQVTDGTTDAPQPTDGSSTSSSSDGAQSSYSTTPSSSEDSPPDSPEPSKTSPPESNTPGPVPTSATAGDNGDIPASSGTNDASPSPPITSATELPSTITTTSSAATSSSSPDSCPISGCPDCKDDLYMDAPSREYFAIEVEAPSSPYQPPTSNLTNSYPTYPSNRTIPHNITRREDTREYTYVCSHITEKVYMAKYPTYKDFTNPNRGFPWKVDDFYFAENTGDCLNHKISKTTSGVNAQGTPVFAMEHIYEGNWILNFLRTLQTTSPDDHDKLSCDQMKDIFFSDAKWINRIMASLGSTQNQDLLVFLRQNINSAKFRIFMDGNDIIGDKPFRKASPKAKLEKIAVVGRALSYMSQDSIGEKIRATAENIEKTFDALVASSKTNPDLKKALGKWGEDGKLKEEHREWLSKFMSSRNAVATASMSQWASAASKQFVATPTAVGTGGDLSKTLSALGALQTKPVKGFDAARWL